MLIQHQHLFHVSRDFDESTLASSVSQITELPRRPSSATDPECLVLAIVLNKAKVYTKLQDE